MPDTYQDVIRALVPWASWALPEASGTDAAPWFGLDHLTYHPTVAYQQAGPFSTAIAAHFTSGGYIIGQRQLPFNLPVTWEAWIKLDSLASGTSRALFGYGAWDGDGYGIFIPAGSTASITFYHPGTGSSGIVPTGFTIPDTNWHHYMMVVPDLVSMYLIVDGVPVARAALPSMVTPSGFPAFLAASNATYPCPAYLSYPTFYTRALGDVEAYAANLAATNPSAALGYITPGTGTILQQILAAVRATY